MRAPGQAQGNFALESALDELSYAVGVDPLELRLRNYAEVRRRRLAVVKQGAARLPRAGRRKVRLVGPRSTARLDARRRLAGWYGMAGVSLFRFQAPCEAKASIRADGIAYVRSSATDIGTGTYTVMTQLSAELLGSPARRCPVRPRRYRHAAGA